MAAGLLSEDDVVRSVMAHLKAGGWTIESFALSHQHGDDIVAVRGMEKLLVEAKGEGSSRVGSRRHGLAFNRNQVRTHVSVAVVRAMQVVSSAHAAAAIALPSNVLHRSEVTRIAVALRMIGVQVFWVAADGSVELQA
ncbi:hypothetical protein B5808_19375 (plasmid) [Cnuibacter physcomitrellae]|uniref:Restriction endonuclease type IV Mrr domain-containing protein n=1 Tax=Cnuibacter physcomitrellae TaxID=1619308 RepID=A0A1X9LU86_9MICO|nr:hypothetical protein B5808_19375 [Cnuibacter physcomitrellae]